ncbi:type VII secretion-associated serine protease mycosin [Streptomyces sp. NPDC050085]|uniref:type VII secretion-associated serine protease mycosin n=1 Tax=Streptomyces sp. NPDC050085 TaxID=3365600 RepID=UPI0037B7F723
MSARTQQVCRFRLASAVAGVALACVAVTPAHAQSVRGQQWYLDAMQAEQMWKTSTGKGITVAIIDTGIDLNLADLRGQVLPGKDYSRGSGDEHTDYDGHGTSMGVLIAGTGAKGQATGSYGLAPGTKVLPIRLPYPNEHTRSNGNPDSYPTYMSKAIRYAADSDAQVINISQGSTDNSPELNKAVAYALSKGKLIFAGVGNTGDGANALEYPAATPGVVGVGAIGKDLKRTSESQSGPQVDLVAPGAQMIAACTGKTGLCESHGTSDATAIASASAALIWSKHPDWTNNQVLRVMLNTASGPVSGQTRTDEIGYGAVRPRIALANPGNPGPADEYPLPDYKAAGSAAPGGVSAKPSRGASASPTASSDDSSSSLPWILAGVGGLVMVGAGGGALAVRGRRRRAAPAAPVPPAPQHGWAQPPHPGQQPSAGQGQPWPYQDTNQTGGQ